MTTGRFDMSRTRLTPILLPCVLLVGACTGSTATAPTPTASTTVPPTSEPPSSPDTPPTAEPPAVDEVIAGYRTAVAPLTESSPGTTDTIDLALPVTVAPDSRAAVHWEDAVARATGTDPVLERTDFLDITVLEAPRIADPDDLTATATLCVAATTTVVDAESGEPIGAPAATTGVPHLREVVALTMVGDDWAVTTTTSLDRVVTDDQLAAGESGLTADDRCVPDATWTEVMAQWSTFTTAYAGTLATGDQGPDAAEEALAFTTEDMATSLFGTPVPLPDGVVRVEASDLDTDLSLVESRWPDEVDVIWCQDPTLNPDAGLYFEDGTFGPRTTPAVVAANFLMPDGTWLLSSYESFPDSEDARTRPRYPEEHTCF